LYLFNLSLSTAEWGFQVNEIRGYRFNSFLFRLVNVQLFASVW